MYKQPDSQPREFNNKRISLWSLLTITMFNPKGKQWQEEEQYKALGQFWKLSTTKLHQQSHAEIQNLVRFWLQNFKGSFPIFHPSLMSYIHVHLTCKHIYVYVIHVNDVRDCTNVLSIQSKLFITLVKYADTSRYTPRMEDD